jgi:hypothetical protein
MSRGRVFAAALTLIVALAGCGASRSGLTRPAGPDSAATAGRYDRQAVPDAVMLPDQAGSYYRDTPGL